MITGGNNERSNQIITQTSTLFLALLGRIAGHGYQMRYTAFAT
jgi:hypothetical protein